METKARHVRNPKYWGAPYDTPLPLPKRFKVPGQTVAVQTSIDQLTDTQREWVNNVGAPDNPAHAFKRRNGTVISVSSERLAQFLSTALDGATPQETKDGMTWYANAHGFINHLVDRYRVSPQVAAAVTSAISPRQRWEPNKAGAETVLGFLTEVGGGDDDQTADDIGVTFRKFVRMALKVWDKNDPNVVTGAKRRSFINNMLDPDNDFDVTVDSWVMTAVKVAYPDSGWTDGDIGAWADHGHDLKDDPVNAGYIIIADAFRKVAKERGITPAQAQAIYWTMAKDGRFGSSVSHKALPLSDWPYTDPYMDPSGGDWTDPDYWDAALIREYEDRGGPGLIESAWQTTPQWQEHTRYAKDNPIAVSIAHQLRSTHHDVVIRIKELLDGFIVLENKIRRVRDTAYWGMPYNTPITPGMRPASRGRGDPSNLEEVFQQLQDQIDNGTLPHDNLLDDEELDLTDADYIDNARTVAKMPQWFRDFTQCSEIRAIAYRLCDEDPDDPSLVDARLSSRLDRDAYSYEAEDMAYALVQGIEHSPEYDGDLFRAIWVPKGRTKNLKVGEEMDVPLVSAGDDQATLEGFFGNRRTRPDPSNFESVTFVFEHPKAVRGNSYKRIHVIDPDKLADAWEEGSIYVDVSETGNLGLDYAALALDRVDPDDDLGLGTDLSFTEYVVGGKFTVKKIKRTKDGAITVTLSQDSVFSIKGLKISEYDDLFDFPLYPGGFRDGYPKTKPMEQKGIIRHVRDAGFWGKPVGTPITPGMKPTPKEPDFSVMPARRFSIKRAANRLRLISPFGRHDGKGTHTDPIDCGDDIDKAHRLLAKNKHVRLNTPLEVSFLIDQLKDEAAYAKAHGKTTPDYNLCNITVPYTNLFCLETKDIPRIKMPQFSGQPVEGSYAETKFDGKESDVMDEFDKVLKELGIAVDITSVPAQDLKATQNELVGTKVGIIKSLMKEGKIEDKEIYVTRDGYVVDGHHRWAAKMALDLDDGVLGDVDMPVKMIDADIGYVIDLANAFTSMAGIKPKATGAQAEGVKMVVQISELLDKFIALESKVGHVRDAAYWGMPVGTPITPGMKPHGKPSTRTTAKPTQKVRARVRVASTGTVDTSANPQFVKRVVKERDHRGSAITDRVSKWSDEDKANAEALVEDTRKRGKVMVAVPTDVVESVLNEGVKSQFATKSSKGALAYRRRAIIESAVFDMPMAVDPEIRPVYGYVSVDDPTQASVAMYGQVRFQLKPSVKKRSSFSFGDSLDDTVMPAAMTGNLSTTAMHSAFGERVNPSKPDGLQAKTYIEAQVHGGIRPTDIAEAFVPEGKVYDKYADMAAKKGIKVSRYQYKPKSLPARVMGEVERRTTRAVSTAIRKLDDEDPNIYNQIKTLLDGFIDIENKVRHVRDTEYWGLPYNTPILPGMKPKLSVPKGTWTREMDEQSYRPGWERGEPAQIGPMTADTLVYKAGTSKEYTIIHWGNSYEVHPRHKRDVNTIQVANLESAVFYAENDQLNIRASHPPKPTEEGWWTPKMDDFLSEHSSDGWGYVRLNVYDRHVPALRLGHGRNEVIIHQTPKGDYRLRVTDTPSLNAGIRPFHTFEECVAALGTPPWEHTDVDTEFTRSLPKLKDGPDSIDRASKATNPQWSEYGPGEYQINCQKCVIAYELRRRGYDVEAAPGCGGDDYSIGMFSWFGADQPKSIVEERRFAAVSRAYGRPLEHEFEGLNALSPAKERRQSVVDRIKANHWPVGSRGVLTVTWGSWQGVPHVVSWEWTKDGLVMIDPQLGRVFDRSTPQSKSASDLFWAHALPDGIYRLDDQPIIGSTHNTEGGVAYMGSGRIISIEPHQDIVVRAK